MDRLDGMRVFVRIVERKSFTLAARDLRLPRATVTYAVKELESRVGVRLLERTTRHVSPTPEGEAHYQRCLRLIADIEEAESAFGAAKIKGLLRVDVHGTMARHFLIPGLPEFLRRYPDIELHMGEGDRLVNLVREGIDCVLRAGEIRDSAMIAKQVGQLEEITCASPAYLRARGTPRTPGELDGHLAVNFISSVTGRPVPFEFGENGQTRYLVLKSALSVSGAEAYTGAALAGLGIIQVPRYHVEDDLAKGRLREILKRFPPPPTPVSLLYPQSRRLSLRVRAFVDWVAERFTATRGREKSRISGP